MEITSSRVRANLMEWRTKLTREITHLEDHLDQIYFSAGLKPHRIVIEDSADKIILESKDESSLKNYESIVDEQIDEIKQAVNHICALISSVTEFVLPIPAGVLLRLAARVGAIRCTDFSRKIPGSLARRYILTNKSLDLIETSLHLYKWISIILGTNILQFQPHINANIISLLEWTRASNLQRHNELRYYDLRSQVIEFITANLERLSLNVNLDSRELASLLETELIKTLEDQPSATTMTSIADGQERAASELKEKYTSDALVCLDRLFVVYADYLDAKLEARLKNFVIQMSIKIYRDFEQNSGVISLASRRRLLCLLETIANRPYATSTTELASHIFELAERIDSDPEIRYLCRRAVKFGLAHRPMVVSNFEVYDCQASAMQNGLQTEQEIESVVDAAAAAAAPEASIAPVESAPICNDSRGEDMDTSAASTTPPGDKTPKENGVVPAESNAPVESSSSKPAESESIPTEGSIPAVHNNVEASVSPPKIIAPAEKNGPAAEALSIQEILAQDKNDGLDEQVQSYLDLFVDKPATTLPAQSLSADTNGQAPLNKPQS